MVLLNDTVQCKKVIYMFSMASWHEVRKKALMKPCEIESLIKTVEC
jgi:hypothetical protein